MHFTLGNGGHRRPDKVYQMMMVQLRNKRPSRLDLISLNARGSAFLVTWPAGFNGFYLMAYHQPKIEYLRNRSMAVASGRRIYDEAEVPEAFYRVEAGCIRLQIHGPDGKRQVLEFCLPGDIFGLDFCDARPMAAEATTTSKLTRFPIHQELRGGTRDDCSALLTASSRIADNLSQILIGFGQSSVAERVVWFLCRIAERQGAPQARARMVHLPMNRRDIADHLGIAPETLSRTLTQLVEAGRIKKAGRSVMLVAPDADTGRSGWGAAPFSVLGARGDPVGAAS